MHIWAVITNKELNNHTALWPPVSIGNYENGYQTGYHIAGNLRKLYYKQ